jgi:hypothetical protein
MAKRRDLQAGGEMIKVPPAHGVGVFGVYTLGENQTAQDVLAMQAELLLSEGIDPTWVPSTAAALLQADCLVLLKPLHSSGLTWSSGACRRRRRSETLSRYG